MDCVFQTEVSDFLQHIALAFELAAVYLVWRDRKQRNQDIRAKTNQGLLTMGLGSVPNRRSGLVIALVVGSIAIALETYQLLTQYYGC